MKTKILRIILLLIMIPSFIGVIDMYWTFYFNHNLSNINWKDTFNVYFALFTLCLVPVFGIELD